MTVMYLIILPDLPWPSKTIFKVPVCPLGIAHGKGGVSGTVQPHVVSTLRMEITV